MDATDNTGHRPGLTISIVTLKLQLPSPLYIYRNSEEASPVIIPKSASPHTHSTGILRRSFDLNSPAERRLETVSHIYPSRNLEEPAVLPSIAIPISLARLTTFNTNCHPDQSSDPASTALACTHTSFSSPAPTIPLLSSLLDDQVDKQTQPRRVYNVHKRPKQSKA
jgi:hypothetical protein